MKKFVYSIFALVLGCVAFSSCDTEIENESIQNPKTFSDLYYQNLRDYKASDHEIAFMWFAQWSAQNSMAVRFNGLPDSLDICSIWGGGIPPKENTQLWDDLRFTQKVKGTKMVYVAIVRLGAEDDSHDFKQVLNEGLALSQDDPRREELIGQAIDMYAMYYVDQVFENDLDGFDADYEPEGDILYGAYMTRFLKKLGEYMGPNPEQTKDERMKLIQTRYGTEHNDVNKILILDSTGLFPDGSEDWIDYWCIQNYGGGTPYAHSGCDVKKQVYCVNWGDNWNTSGDQLYNQARFKPATGRKGGFGAFYGQRDYFIHQYNSEPYGRFRKCIQIQNPAIY